MRLGLGIGITRIGGVAAAPVTLYDTGDFTGEQAVAYREILDVDSFRLCRDASFQGRYIISSVPSGSYRITGTLAAYDGAIAGITTTRLRLLDGFTSSSDLTVAGAIDETISITSGTLRFDAAAPSAGARFDNFFIEAA